MFKQLIGVFFTLSGMLLGLYVGGWHLFIKPIIDCCRAFDAGTLTGFMVGVSIIKCIFAISVGGSIMWLLVTIGIFIKEL